jgi:uracil-DNA glycosylase
VPFHPTAPVGQRFEKWLSTSGIPRRLVLVGNVVQCWLPKFYKGSAPDGNRDPTRAEMKWCWNAHVGPWLTDLPDDLVIVPVGIPSTKFLMGIPEDEGAEKYLGTLNDVELPMVGENNALD